MTPLSASPVYTGLVSVYVGLVHTIWYTTSLQRQVTPLSASPMYIGVLSVYIGLVPVYIGVVSLYIRRIRQATPLRAHLSESVNNLLHGLEDRRPSCRGRHERDCMRMRQYLYFCTSKTSKSSSELPRSTRTRLHANASVFVLLYQ